MTSTAQRPRAKHEYTFTKASLFGLAKQIGLMPDEAKDMAYSLIGKDSLTKFTQKELNEVCQELIARKEGNRRSRGRITDRQLYKVREYERLLGWDNDPQRLAGFIKKDYHIDNILWMSVSQGAKLIDGLKSMYERELVKSR